MQRPRITSIVPNSSSTVFERTQILNRCIKIIIDINTINLSASYECLLSIIDGIPNYTTYAHIGNKADISMNVSLVNGLITISLTNPTQDELNVVVSPLLDPGTYTQLYK